MRAVRGAEGGVIVDDVDEPPGAGELLDMRATSVCASDLSVSSSTGSPASSAATIRGSVTSSN